MGCDMICINLFTFLRELVKDRKGIDFIEDFFRYCIDGCEALTKAVLRTEACLDPLEALKYASAILARTKHDYLELLGSLKQCLRATKSSIDEVIEGFKRGLNAVRSLYRALDFMFSGLCDKFAEEIIQALRKEQILDFGRAEPGVALHLMVQGKSTGAIIKYYNMPGTIYVVNEDREYGRSYNVCPLGSWIKGHMRLLTHGLVEVAVLNDFFEKGLEKDKLYFAALLTTLAFMLIHDDTRLVLRADKRGKGCSEDGISLISLVPLLLGAGEWSSSIYIKPETVYSPVEFKICKYVVKTDDITVYRIAPILLTIMKESEGGAGTACDRKRQKSPMNLNEIRTLLEHIDAVMSVVLAYFSVKAHEEYMFYKLTAQYPYIRYSLVPKPICNVQVSVTPETLTQALTSFCKLLQTYAHYLILKLDKLKHVVRAEQGG